MSHIEVDGTILEPEPISAYHLEWVDYVVFIIIAFAVRKLIMNMR